MPHFMTLVCFCTKNKGFGFLIYKNKTLSNET